MGEMGGVEGKGPLGRPRRRWKDIKKDLQEVRCEDMDWIELAQNKDRWRGHANVDEPLGSTKCREFLD